MTGVLRSWWWLIVGSASIVVGVVLISTVPVVATCAEVGVLPPGQTEPPVSACAAGLDAAQRNWIVGSVLVLVGLAIVAFGLGHRRGRRAALREQSFVDATP